MNYKTTSIVSLFFLFTTTFLFAQKNDYGALTINDSLKENADAVVRLNQVDIVIASQRGMNIKNKRVVTVLNENGLDAIEAYENYDKRSPVRNIMATIYDVFGKEIKKIKRADFKDVSAISGSTLFRTVAIFTWIIHQLHIRLLLSMNVKQKHLILLLSHNGCLWMITL